MPISSQWQIDIPNVSLPTFVFTSPTASLSNTPTFISTAAPDRDYITYAGFRLLAQRLAAGLRKSGFIPSSNSNPGDRLLLFSGNALSFPSVFMGVIMAGGIFTGANPTYVARELAYQLTNSGAKIMFCARTALDTALEAAKEAGLDKRSVFIFDDEGVFPGSAPASGVGDVKHWTSLLVSEEEGRGFHWDELTTKEELDRTIALNYSSGTTGLPKGVEITHYNYVSNCRQVAFREELDPGYNEKLKKARWLGFLPMYVVPPFFNSSFAPQNYTTLIQVGITQWRKHTTLSTALKPVYHCT
jgi:4-coumarate--CoA ligase